MDEQPKNYTLLTTKSGEQIPISSPENVIASVFIMNDPIVSQVKLDMTPDEFEDLKQLAKTNSVSDDTIKAKEMKD